MDGDLAAALASVKQVVKQRNPTLGRAGTQLSSPSDYSSRLTLNCSTITSSLPRLLRTVLISSLSDCAHLVSFRLCSSRLLRTVLISSPLDCALRPLTETSLVFFIQLVADSQKYCCC